MHERHNYSAVGHSWRDRRVFITGATGLVGQWLTRALLERGARPVILVHTFREEVQQFVGKCKIVPGAVEDQELLEQTLVRNDIDVVFHLAAQAIVTQANTLPGDAYKTNVMGTVALLEAVRLTRPDAKVVIASSDKAYGDSVELPYMEDTPLLGRNPYDCSKSCQDLIAQSYLLTKGLNIAITRNGNIYGGGDTQWNRLVPGTIRRLLRDETPIVRGTGEQTRDLFYVEDVVKAYMTLVEKDAMGAYNFSTGDELTVKSIVETICRLMNKPVHYNMHLVDCGEISYQVLDSSRARVELGWSPQFTLEEGLAKTIEWYREYLR